ncbi:MAG: GDPmannose 4,6-dehydratase [Patescibacteria group bacterium]|nr:GDPmannose 4,6-dehydratase [Patescibacteria group bacterium]
MSKKAFITGITGQDASYLVELLHELDYEIFGLIRGQRNPRRELFEKTYPYVTLVEGDLLDQSSLIHALNKIKPDEIYNLGAISYVARSFIEADLTAQVNGVGLIRLLESVRVLGLENKTRVYHASTSELFGKVRETPQNETTPFHPRSPYGNAKALAHYTAVNYRESYSMFVSCGILFNHESPRRGKEFVTRKITNSVARINLGLQESLNLGVLTSRRDWGYAKDYVEGMWKMLQHTEPDDFVLATGEAHSVEDFVREAFNVVGISDWESYVEYDKNSTRPADVDLLVGDATKAKEVLGWQPTIAFKDLVKIMVDSDVEQERSTQGHP